MVTPLKNVRNTRVSSYSNSSNGDMAEDWGFFFAIERPWLSPSRPTVMVVSTAAQRRLLTLPINAATSVTGRGCVETHFSLPSTALWKPFDARVARQR
jgi:hypothetical protein